MIQYLDITPSRFKDMMTSGRGKDELFGETAKAYALQIASSLCGAYYQDIMTYPMEHGIVHESEAINAFEEQTYKAVVLSKERMIHPKYSFVSGECDGVLVDEDALIEVKCPQLHNHLRNLTEWYQIEMYKWQIQGYLWLYNKAKCYFVSYHPETIFNTFGDTVTKCPKELQLGIKIIDRDEAIIKKIEERIVPFWNLVQEYKKTLMKE